MVGGERIAGCRKKFYKLKMKVKIYKMKVKIREQMKKVMEEEESEINWGKVRERGKMREMAVIWEMQTEKG